MENQITEQQIHQLVPLAENAIATASTPVEKIEDGLSTYLQHIFSLATEENEFHKKIQAEVINRLPDLKPNELIALFTNNATARNDLVSKTMTPTLQLATARQQNELANKQQQMQNSPQYHQTNIRELNTQSSADVLLGLQALFNLSKVVAKKEDDTIDEALTAS